MEHPISARAGHSVGFSIMLDPVTVRRREKFKDESISEEYIQSKINNFYAMLINRKNIKGGKNEIQLQA